MPIYDYQCSSCGFKDEVMRKISAPNIEACPKCAAETFSKQLSAPSFQLNGSGWYATDFKHGNKTPAKTDSKAETNNSDSAKTADSKNDAPKADTAVEKKPNAASAACASGCGCH